MILKLAILELCATLIVELLLFDVALLSSDNVHLAFLRTNAHSLTESMLMPGLAEISPVPVGLDAHHRPARLSASSLGKVFPGGTLLALFAWPLFVPFVRRLGAFGFIRVHDGAHALILGMITNFDTYSVFFSDITILLRRLPFIRTILVLPHVQDTTAVFEASST